MVNPYRHVAEWIDNVQAQAKIDKQEQDILKPYNMNIYIQKSELETADEAKIREELRARLGPFLKSNQVANAFIDYLDKNSDLTNFYQLEKPFMREIAGIRRIDLPYLTQLWEKYRNSVLKRIEQRISQPETYELLRAPTPVDIEETQQEEHDRLLNDVNRGIIPFKNRDELYSTLQRAQGRINSLRIRKLGLPAIDFRKNKIVRIGDPRYNKKLIEE